MRGLCSSVSYRLATAVFVLVITLSFSACAFDVGSPFATVSATLSATLDLDELTHDEHGWIQLDAERSLQLTEATLVVGEVRLLGSSSSDMNATEVFDPAHPPEGYSMCHGGHCHSATGALVDYATIQEELSASHGNALIPVLSMTSVAQIDLLNPSVPRSLACPLDPKGECALEEGQVLRVELSVASIHFKGLFRTTANEAPLAVDLVIDLNAMEEGLFVHAANFKARRHGEKHFLLDMKMTVPREVLLEVDWANPQVDQSHFKHLFSESAFTLGDEASPDDHAGHDHSEHDHSDHDHEAHASHDLEEEAHHE